jgi:hypothetical protein
MSRPHAHTQKERERERQTRTTPTVRTGRARDASAPRHRLERMPPVVVVLGLFLRASGGGGGRRRRRGRLLARRRSRSRSGGRRQGRTRTGAWAGMGGSGGGGRMGGGGRSRRGASTGAVEEQPPFVLGAHVRLQQWPPQPHTHLQPSAHRPCLAIVTQQLPHTYTHSSSAVRIHEAARRGTVETCLAIEHGFAATEQVRQRHEHAAKHGRAPQEAQAVVHAHRQRPPLHKHLERLEPLDRQLARVVVYCSRTAPRR